jgi:ATP-dependent DNA ligase
LRTRHGRRCDGEFPEIVSAGADLPDVILDGEIVQPDDRGSPDFAALRARLGSRPDRARAIAAARPAAFYAFDVIWHKGMDLRDSALFERRRILETLPLARPMMLVETHTGQA